MNGYFSYDAESRLYYFETPYDAASLVHRFINTLTYYYSLERRGLLWHCRVR